TPGSEIRRQSPRRLARDLRRHRRLPKTIRLASRRTPPHPPRPARGNRRARESTPHRQPPRRPASRRPLRLLVPPRPPPVGTALRAVRLAPPALKTHVAFHSPPLSTMKLRTLLIVVATLAALSVVAFIAQRPSAPPSA